MVESEDGGWEMVSEPGIGVLGRSIHSLTNGGVFPEDTEARDETFTGFTTSLMSMPRRPDLRAFLRAEVVASSKESKALAACANKSIASHCSLGNIRTAFEE